MRILFIILLAELDSHNTDNFYFALDNLYLPRFISVCFQL